MLTQVDGSGVVSGTNSGETIEGTLTGRTFVFHSANGAYKANATLTVAPGGMSWSGPAEDTNGTKGTYTATRGPNGSLSQLASPFNCVGEVDYPNPGEESLIGCGTLLPVEAINATYQAPVSPDGRNVYSVAISGALVEYARNQTTGSLAEIGCVTAGSTACASENSTTKAIAMSNPAAIAFSPGGEDVYVITQGTNSIVEFSRNAETGLLTERGCLSRENAECASHENKGLHSPYGITVSLDGKSVYVASFADEAVAEFSRNTSTGKLTQLSGANNCITSGTKGLTGCETEGAFGLERAIGVVVSPDGKNVYIAAGATNGEGAVVAFERNTSTGALTQLPGTEGCISTANAKCAPGVAIDGPEDIVISPDGRDVYTNSSQNNAVLEFRRESSGALAQLTSPNSCLMNAPAAAGCSEVKGLKDALGVAISPGGENVYASSPEEDDEAAFTRNAETGVLAPLPAPYECIGKTGKNTCGTSGSTGIAGARRVTVSPDGRNLYVAGQNDHSVVELVRAVPSPEPGPSETPKATSQIPAGKPATSPAVLPPMLFRTGNVAPVSGKVLVKLPGSKQFVPLQTLRQIPFGSVIDATNGTVSVTTALPGGGTQTGQFFSGEFILRQERSGLVVAELTGGNFSVCPTKRERAHIARVAAAHAHAAASGKHVVRKLWANAHGKFSTKGNYAAGAVQGTEWLTEDLCEGTLIRVTRDKVAVTNLVNHRHVVVKTGHKYLAKAP